MSSLVCSHLYVFTQWESGWAERWKGGWGELRERRCWTGRWRMTRCVLLISKIANDARTAGLEPELMKGAVTPEPQGVLFKKKKKKMGRERCKIASIALFSSFLRLISSLSFLSSYGSSRRNLKWYSSGGHRFPEEVEKAGYISRTACLL